MITKSERISRIIMLVILVMILVSCEQKTVTTSTVLDEANDTLVGDETKVVDDNESLEKASSTSDPVADDGNSGREVAAFDGFDEPLNIDWSDEEVKGLSVEFSVFIDQILQIQDLMTTNNNKDVEEVNHATLAVLRNKSYGYNSGGLRAMVWNTYAGNLKTETHIDTEADSILLDDAEYIADRMRNIHDPDTKDEIDVHHLFSGIDIWYTDFSNEEIEERFYDHLFSWGGDLETFMSDAVNYLDGGEGMSAIEVVSEFTEEALLSKEYSFPIDDLLADIDGANIALLLRKENILLSEALSRYYSGGHSSRRYDYFVRQFGGQEGFIEAVNAVSLETIDDQMLTNDARMTFYKDYQVVKGMITTFGNDGTVGIPEEVRLGVVKGFRSVILEKAADQAR